MITALATSNFYGYGYGGYGFGWFDPTYWLVIVGLIITLIASANVKSTFARYDKVLSRRGITAAEAARRILDANGLHSIRIERVAGDLTDHFSPKENVIRLSDSTYNSTSIAALGVAAHECGHAVQHAVAYAPLKMRSALVPVVTFASQWVTWVILIGILVINVFPGLIWIGILLFASTTVFSFITLPVEVDASRRALSWLSQSNITTAQTSNQASDALRSAAYTYVVGAISSLGTLLYYISIARRD